MAILQGRDIGRLRAETDALKERERLLVQTGETVERIVRMAALLDGLKTNLEKLTARHAGILEEIVARSDQKNLLEKDIVSLETQVALLGRIRDLEEERKRLEDGQPCPLCGATEHPYAKGNLPVLNQAEADLKKRKDEFKKISQRLAELEADRVKTEAEIRHIEGEMAEKKTVLETDRKQCAAALSRLITQGAEHISVMPDLIRHPDQLILDSGVRRNDDFASSPKRFAKRSPPAGQELRKRRKQSPWPKRRGNRKSRRGRAWKR